MMKTRERQSLTTRQLADSLGVSESSVKRWIDDGEIAAERTAGGHRRIPMVSAVRFMRRHRIGPGRAGDTPRSAVPLLGAVDGGAADACYEALLKDDMAQARAIITGRYVAGADVATIGDGLIRPVLARLGELWAHDSHGVLVEHRAVDMCIRALADLAAWLPAPSPASPVAITAGGPGDPYLLPPMLASMALQEQGVNAHNLGPSTPLETLVLAAERYGAAICSLSVSTPQDRRRRSEWVALADRLQGAGTGLVVGGRCVESLPAEVLGRAHRCGSMVELGSYAAGVVRGARSGPKPRERRKP